MLCNISLAYRKADVVLCNNTPLWSLIITNLAIKTLFPYTFISFWRENLTVVPGKSLNFNKSTGSSKIVQQVLSNSLFYEYVFTRSWCDTLLATIVYLQCGCLLCDCWLRFHKICEFVFCAINLATIFPVNGSASKLTFHTIIIHKSMQFYGISTISWNVWRILTCMVITQYLLSLQ